MPAATVVSLLEASTLLIVLPFFSQGKVSIEQVEFVNGERKSWPVDSVATVELGSGRNFAFDCGLSNELSGCINVWGRTDGKSVVQQSTGITNQVQLAFDESTSDSLTEYVCVVYGCNSAQDVFLSVTEANPAVLPVQQDRLIAANVGDSVSIEFKISSLPVVMPSNIKWFHENDPISTTENFREDRKSLVIDNVQLSDAGHYQVEVCVSSQCQVQHTNLSVTDLTAMTTSHIMPAASSSNTPSLTPSPSISSSAATDDASSTLGQTFSSRDQLHPSSSTTTLPQPTTTSVPTFSTKSVRSTLLTAQPGLLQTTPTATSTCSTTAEEEDSLSEYITVVTAAVVLLVTALTAIAIAMLIVLLVWKRGRKNPTSEESSFTKSKEFSQSSDSTKYTTHNQVNGHSKAAFGKIIITV